MFRVFNPLYVEGKRHVVAGEFRCGHAQIMWSADAFERRPTVYDSRLSDLDRRAIKRLIRCTRHLSQVIRSMTLQDDGRVTVHVGDPPVGTILIVGRRDASWVIESRESVHSHHSLVPAPHTQGEDDRDAAPATSASA